MTIKVYGADWCGDCRRAKQVLDSHKADYEYIDLVAHPEEKDTALKLSGRRNIPVVVYPDGSIQSEPTNEDIESKLQ